VDNHLGHIHKDVSDRHIGYVPIQPEETYPKEMEKNKQVYSIGHKSGKKVDNSDKKGN